MSNSDSSGLPAGEADKKVLAEGRWLRLVMKGHWEYAERPNVTGTVGMVPVTDDGKIVLVEQHRIPVGRQVIELPAGLVGDTPEGRMETPAQAALRELLEETGYHADALAPLTQGASSAGMTNETVSLFLATGLKKVGPGGGDGSEKILVHEIPLEQAEDWLAGQIQGGAIVDLKVYLGLYFAFSRGLAAGKR